MKLAYTIRRPELPDDIKLTEAEITEIYTLFRETCIAEHLLENYEIESEDAAMSLASDVLREIYKYDVDEDWAIEYVMGENGIPERT